MKTAVPAFLENETTLSFILSAGQEIGKKKGKRTKEVRRTRRVKEE